MRSDAAGLREEAGAGRVECGVGPDGCCGVAWSRQAESQGQAESAEKNSFLKRDFETYFKYLKHAFNSNLKTLFEIGFEYIMSLFVKYILN